LYGLCDLPANELVTITVYNRNQALVESTIEAECRSYAWLDRWLLPEP
jgi:hypothetical protein